MFQTLARKISSTFLKLLSTITQNIIKAKQNFFEEKKLNLVKIYKKILNKIGIHRFVIKY